MNYNDIRSLELLTIEIEQSQINIAPTYEQWMRFSFAIAYCCKEEGREFYHRICKLSPLYDVKDTDHLYDNALKKSDGRLKLDTVFDEAERFGVDVKAVKARIDAERPQSKELSVSDLPTLGKHDWPRLIMKVLDLGKTDEQKDVLFLSTLTALGITLGKSVYIEYDGDILYPSFQVTILGRAASGKSIMKYPVKLAEPLHNALKEQSEEKRRNTPKGQPKPPRQLFLLPADSTAAAIKNCLAANNGWGLITTTELDTLSQALLSSFGNWDDVKRKFFSHERIEYARKLDDEYGVIEKPIVSILGSGTPDQLRNLIRNAQNGSFSREIFYNIDGIHYFENRWGKKSEKTREEIMNDIALEWEALRQQVAQHGPFSVELKEGQGERLDAFFNALQEEYEEQGMEIMESSVIRLGITICRAIAVICVVRDLEQGEASEILNDTATDKTLYPTEEDFTAVLSLARPLFEHAIYTMRLLTPTAAHGTNAAASQKTSAQAILDFMQDVFISDEYIKAGMAVGIRRGTLETRLTRLRKARKIEATGKPFEYRKVSVSVM